MTLLITYQELQQLVADKLHQNIEFQSISTRALKLTVHTAIKKIVTINVDASAELELSIYGNDLYVDYKVLPIDNIKSGTLSGLIDSFAPNVVNIVLNYLSNKYPQYSAIVEKVPNADRLRIHLAAIPQLKNVLQHVEIESIIPQETGLQIIFHLKNINCNL